MRKIGAIAARQAARLLLQWSTFKFSKLKPGIQDQLLDTELSAGLILGVGVKQRFQTSDNGIDLSTGLADLGAGFIDSIQDCPVGEEAIIKVICESHKSIYTYLYIRLNGNIGQLGFQAAKLSLETFHFRLGIVQMAVLGYI